MQVQTQPTVLARRIVLAHLPAATIQKHDHFEVSDEYGAAAKHPKRVSRRSRQRRDIQVRQLRSGLYIETLDEAALGDV